VALFDGVEIGSKKLSVAISAPPKLSNADGRTLFLNNLPFTVKEEDIREKIAAFKEFIVEIRIIYNDEGQPKGYAFVEFNDAQYVV